jgi:hypothetical protein
MLKRKRTLSLVFGLSLLLSLISSDSTAQPEQRFFAVTGMISPGPNQIIRLTVNAGAENDTITVRFMETDYMKGPCSPDGACKYTVKSEKTSAPLTLAPGEGASFDLNSDASNTEDSHPYPNAFARGVVLSNSRNAQVIAQIINTVNGNVVVAFELTNDFL